MTLTKNTQLDTKPDSTLKTYFRRKERFADFINSILFAGMPIIHIDRIYDYDSDSSTLIEQEYNILSVGKNRDIIMKIKYDDISILIGLENQQTIDYSMPYRVLIYDIISYLQQYNILDKNKQRHFHPIPVLTCVLYCGENKWIQPKTFLDMMNIPKVFLDKINNWNGNVIDIKDIHIETLHNPDNRKLVEAVQRLYRWNKDITCLSDMNMSKEVAIVVATIIGEKELVEVIKEDEKEELNMCTAIQEFVQEKKQEGIEEGLMQGQCMILIQFLKKRLGFISDEIIIQIQESSQLQLDQLTTSMMDIEKEEDISKIITF